MKLIHLSVFVALGLAASGCNIFSPFDKPSGDAQLLSAARACFDRGDFSCASEHYQKLSADQADIVASDAAFLALDQAGATMGAFAQFIGDGAGGVGLTGMAEKLASGAGQSKRSAIYQAYLRYSTISAANPDLKYFVQFVAALSLAAEILAEKVSASGQLFKTAISQSPSGCTTSNCGFTAGCGAGGSTLAMGNLGDIDTNDPSTTATPDSDMLFWAINKAYNALNNLNPGGSFGGTSSGLGAIINATQPGTNPAINQCFRAQLLSFGIGR